MNLFYNLIDITMTVCIRPLFALKYGAGLLNIWTALQFVSNENLQDG